MGDRNGLYRRGYVSCRWEVHAEHRHFITVQFNQFDLGDKPQCATGFLELSDSVHDSDHMRRYCNDMGKMKWYTTSSKLFVEYLFDIDDTSSHFDMRLDQTKGCVLPKLPKYGKSMQCSYSSSLKVECTVTCNKGVLKGPAYCHLYHGTWHGDMDCVTNCRDVGRVFLTSREVGASGKTGRIFCQGTLIFSIYVLLPAHCIAAAKKLKSYQLKLRLKSGKNIYRSVDSDAVFVNPEFRLVSYNKRDFLFNDIALIALKYPLKPKTFLSARINLAKQPQLSKVMYDRRNAYHVTNDYDCDTDGLASNQICLVSDKQGNHSIKGKVQEHSEQLQLDPRQGYYRQSCWDKSGSALLTRSCQMSAITLVADCRNNVKIALRLDSYSDWIRSTIMTDLLKTKRWKTIKHLRRFFIREVKRAKTC